MKKAIILFATLFFAIGWVSAQDVYFAGNHNGTGKIWKNDTLAYSLSDSTRQVILSSLQVTTGSSIYAAGHLRDTAAIENKQALVWMNDSIVFEGNTSTAINSLVLNDGSWTAGGIGSNEWEEATGLVWQDGEMLYAYSDSTNSNQILSIAIDPATGDVYAGGFIGSENPHACVWKNDAILWQSSATSGINALCFAEGNLYAAGFSFVGEDICAVLWQNDSIIFSIESPDAEFSALAYYNGSIYLGGHDGNTVYIWQDDEVLYDHACTEHSSVYAMTANEFGVYYAGQIDGIATVWKDGEVLYQPEDCNTVIGLAVLEVEPPQPTFTLTVEVDSIGGGTVTGGGTYNYGDTVTIEAIPDMGCEFLFWNDGIVTNPRDIIITQDTTFIAHFNHLNYNIETEVIPMDAGTVTGGGSYHYGDTITLEAVANGGYEFERWLDSITDNPRTVVVTQDSLFIAMFGVRQYTITVESDHPGWGSVTGGGTYYYGDTIQISATAHLGFEFESWDDGNTDNPRDIIVTEDHTYTAHFRVQQCLIKTDVTPQGAGTVTGGGTYDYGTTIHLTAHSNTGYVYSMWNDGVMDNPRSVFVEGNASYTAVFTPMQYEITTECDPEEGGTVTGAGTYDYGSTAVLTATANDNYTFICWNDGIITNPRNVTVTGNANYKALFHLNGTPQYTITVLANDPSLGTVTGSGTYPEGTTINIGATPNTGAYFMGWDDGNTENPRIVTVTQTMTFTALFTEVQTFTITVRPEYPLLGTTYGGGTYPANTVVTIGATPNPNFYFSGWQDGNMDNPRSITVTEDAEYIASFSQNPVQTYTVTVYFDETQGFILGAGTYTAGATASIAAIAADGFVFKKWNDDTTDNPKEVVVDHDIFLAAFFESNDVDESNFDHLRLYPNPANDKICIEGLDGEHEVLIYNAIGALVKTATLSEGQEIGINDLSSGLYLVRIDNSHAIRFIKKQ